MPAPEITQFFSKYLVIFSDRPKQRNKDVAMLLEMHGDAQPRHDAVHGLSKHVGQQADRSLFVEFDEHNDIRHRNMGEPGLMVDRRRQHRPAPGDRSRSEEHTSELQSLMRISYAVLCLKKNNMQQQPLTIQHIKYIPDTIPIIEVPN